MPLREVVLDASSGEPPVPIYDPSGPYTDPDAAIDVERGLPRRRTAWVRERGGVEEYQGRAIKPVDNGNVIRQASGAEFCQYAEAAAGDRFSLPAKRGGWRRIARRRGARLHWPLPSRLRRLTSPFQGEEKATPSPSSNGRAPESSPRK